MNTFFERIHRVDTAAFIWLNQKRYNAYPPLIRWISRTGDGPLYLIIGLFILSFNDTKGASFFKIGTFSYILNVGLYWVLKNSIRRNRPFEKLNFFRAQIVPSDKFSFPSGHTAAAFVFASLVFLFFPTFFFSVFLWASLIGFSRVALGVHYPGDILAGACLGISSVLVTAATLNNLS